MMGTNDIRKNRGTDAINNIPKIKKYTNNHTIIPNIPPTNIDVGNEETNDEIIQDRINYNKKINNTFTRTAKTTELNKAMRTDPTSILKRDGIHLTDNEARLIATTWIRTIEEPTTEDTQAEQDRKTIEEEQARHIVGKEGRNLKTLKDKYDINMTTNNNNNNNLIITAKGRPNNKQKAFSEIRSTINTQ